MRTISGVFRTFEEALVLLLVRKRGRCNARLHGATKVAPGLRVLAGAVEARGPLLPAGLAPVHARLAVVTQGLYHGLQCIRQ